MRAGDALRAFERLPFADVRDVVGTAPPLVLAPHPDDESLGCGGLIAACVTQGHPPVVVIVTDGAGSHPGSPSYPPARLSELREGEAREATARLGLPADRLHFLRLPDRFAPHDGPDFERAVAVLCEIARDNGCGTVVAPWLHDPHCDHEAVQLMARAVAQRAARPLLSYPVWGWTLPHDVILPDAPVRGWRIDIAPHLDAKRRAIDAHASQMTDLIDDDEAGFRVPRDLLGVFERPYEVFLRES